MVKKKVILTGFYPFGNYKFNPTEDIVKYYNHRNIYPDIEIIGLLLPCSFDSFVIIDETIDNEKPDAIISMGLFIYVRGVRIETTFRNLMNGGKISTEENAQEFLASNTNNLFLANILHRNNIPVEISSYVDSFSNYLGYLTTQKILNNHMNVRNMFISIPLTDDYKDKINLEHGQILLKKRDIYDAIELLIKNI